jgi:guanylate kinase
VIAAPARLTVLSGPSGVGKGSVVTAVRRRHPEVWVSVSVTTRPARPGEIDGVEYHFVDDAAFRRLVGTGQLLEHDAHFGAQYGTPRAPVAERLAGSRPCLLEIDIAGARQVRAALPEARLVFLTAPSWAELQRRLRTRATEDDDRLAARLERARVELAAEGEFDHAIVNDDVEAAADRLVALMQF